MKCIILTSNGLRHSYFINAIKTSFEIVGCIREPKKNYYNKIRDESTVVRDHFKRLSDAENRIFGKNEINNIDILNVDKKSINDKQYIEWVKSKDAECIFLFGTGILGLDWLNLFPHKIINLHLGISPYYRGSGTMFWPFYENKYGLVGTTTHIAARDVDAGSIISRHQANYKEGESYYQVVNKTIKDSIDMFPLVCISYLNNRINPSKQILNEGKTYYKKDFTEQKILDIKDKLLNGLSNYEICNIRLLNEDFDS